MRFRVLARLQQERGSHSWARRVRDRELWDALNCYKDELKRERSRARQKFSRQISGIWPEEHLCYWSPGDDEKSRAGDNTKLLAASLFDGWRRGIPPDRSLAWYVAQKRPLNPIMVASILHRCRAPFVAWEFFSWASKQSGFRHSATSCAMLLRVYFIGRFPDAALSFFKREVPGICNPSELLYNVVIQGLCLAGRVHEAVEVYNEMTGALCVPRPGIDTEMILRKGMMKMNGSSSGRMKTRRRSGAEVRANRRLTFRTKVLSQGKLIHSCKKSVTLRMRPPKRASWKAIRYLDLE